MLYFVACMFLISKATEELEAPEDIDDASLVLVVEDTFIQCMDIVAEVGDFVGIFENEEESRRRTVASGVKGKLKACEEIAQASALFMAHGNIGFPFGIVWSEAAFLQNLLSAVSKRMGDVLYTASKDGDAAINFHNACDDEGPTVVIVETTSGKVFGGYADMSWGSGGTYISSSTSFLFRLRPTMAHYPIIKYPQHAMYHNAGYGPSFGGGHDLHIASDAMDNTGSYTNGHTYTSGNELNDGEQNFQVKDYIVLKAIDL